MPLTLNGRVVPIERAFPFLLGDWRALQRMDISEGRVQKMLKALAAADAPRFEDPDALAAILLHAARKVDPSVTEAEIDALSVGAALEAWLASITPPDAPDRPTSPPSTSSPSGTAGEPRTPSASPPAS